jgi:hypothetical protein
MSEGTLFLSQYWLLERSSPASVVRSCLFELIEKVITTDSLLLAMKKKTCPSFETQLRRYSCSMRYSISHPQSIL